LGSLRQLRGEIGSATRTMRQVFGKKSIPNVIHSSLRMDGKKLPVSYQTQAKQEYLKAGLGGGLQAAQTAGHETKGERAEPRCRSSLLIGGGGND